VAHAALGSFAPDGRSVVFEAICKTGICITSSKLDGSGAKTLIACTKVCLLYEPVWSPSGRQLAYARQRDAGGFVWTTVRVGNADGSGDHALVGEGNPCNDQGGARWSPDGSRIAFSCADAIYVVGAKGGIPRRACAGDVYTWSPDGGSLACSQGDPTGLYFKGWVRITDLASGRTRVLLKRHAYSLAWHA
jgi:dipeptidyl aminopeptidase/acylaminoacyl peptidase